MKNCQTCEYCYSHPIEGDSVSIAYSCNAGGGLLATSDREWQELEESVCAFYKKEEEK